MASVLNSRYKKNWGVPANPHDAVPKMNWGITTWGRVETLPWQFKPCSKKPYHACF